MPEERKPKKGAISWGALGSPLVESAWELHATFDFRRYVKHDAYWHIEINAAKVLVYAQ